MKFRFWKSRAKGGYIPQRPGGGIPVMLSEGVAVVPDNYPLTDDQIAKINGGPTQVFRASEVLAAMDADVDQARGETEDK